MNAKHETITRKEDDAKRREQKGGGGLYEPRHHCRDFRMSSVHLAAVDQREVDHRSPKAEGSVKESVQAKERADAQHQEWRWGQRFQPGECCGP